MPFMPDTRSHAWEQAGLAAQIARRDARRARNQALVLVPLLAGVLVVYALRATLIPDSVPHVVIRGATFVLLLVLGWALARAFGRAIGPALFRRLDPGTAGTVGFMMRIGTLGVALLVALRIAGLKPEALAVGGAVTAVVLGLAAQQTFGNVFAGLVLISSRPFRVGDRVRLIGGPVGGQTEGIVSSLGLLHTTLIEGGETKLVPNNVLLGQVIQPLREPDAVDLRARLRAGVKPSDLQELLEEAIDVPTRSEPAIVVEEIDGDEMVVRVRATPHSKADGAKLADEVLAALGQVTRSDSADRAPQPAA